MCFLSNSPTKGIEAHSDLEPPEELEKGICQSLRYCTEQEYQLSEQAIDEVEATIDKESGSK
jgi:hypothetical protein